MKRFLIGVLALTVILALLPMSSAMAQMTWEGGVKGGINLAKFWGDDADDLEFKVGAVGGPFVTAHVSEMLGIRLEALYSQKGAKETETGSDLELKLKNDYIEIPLLAVVSMEAGEKMTVDLFAGPALSILVSSNWEMSVDDAAVEVDVKDHMKSVDFGGAIGAGFTYNFDAAKFAIEVRYTLGFAGVTDFSDEMLEDMMATEQPDVKNNAISIMAGFAIPFGAAAQ